MSITNTSRNRYAGLLASVAIALGGFALPGAYAQSDEAADDLIIVTGTRIRQNPLETTNPVQNLGEEDLNRTGLTQIGDILGKLPITGSAINSANNASGNLGFPPDGAGIGAGAAEVELRNLSAKRTLVLVDGKRWINGSSASGVPGSVDLNTIPVGIIDRIEVLQDGASPIYGSDAIAGVVNIITRSDFDGIRASAYYGLFGDGDGETQNYDVSMGVTGDRARVVFDVSYARQKDVLAADREISQFPIAGIGMCLATCSSGTPQGRFVFNDPNTMIGSSITLNNGVLNDGAGNIPVFDPLNPGTAGDFHDFTTADRFNFQPFNFLQTPNERLNIFGKAEYDLTDSITFRMVGSYTNRQSANQAAPEPLFIGPEAGNGNIMDTVTVAVDNPFNPFGFALDSNNLIFAGRRPIEAGVRLFKQNVDTWFVGGTLDGITNIGGNDVYWDVNFSFSQAQANQRKTGAFNAANLKRALGPLALCVDGMGASIDGCVPFNFFGGQGVNGEGSITPEMLGFVTFIQKDESQQEQFDVSVNIAGEMFELPAGPIGYALGFEHRKQEGFFIPDAIVTAGQTAGVPAFPTAGGFDVNEVYGEVSVPILHGLPLVELFEINGAVRYSDYNLFGGDEVFKIGANWRVTDDLLIRGNFSEGFRAPGIGELFNTGSRFDATIDDPCSDMLGLDPNGSGMAASAATIANCTTLGVPADGSFVSIGGQISVNTGGNQNLTPETSESYTIGFVYDPAWAGEIGGLDSLLIEANYYDISIDSAIQAPNAQTKLTQCVATLDPLTCAGINRTAAGTINSFASQLGNIGGIETNGFDWSITLTSAETGIGQFRLQSINTYLNEYTEIVATSTGVSRLAREGIELGSPERGFTKFKSTLIADWTHGAFGASVTARYLGSLMEACPDAVLDLAPQLCSNAAGSLNKIDSKVFTDIQASWTPPMLDDAATLTFGVNNLLDTDIPFCFSCDLNSFDGTLYPIPGRFFYGRISLKL